MLSIINRLRNEPAAWYQTGLGTIAALIIAAAHLDVQTAAVVSGLAVAVGTVIAAFQTHPWDVTAIAGAAGVVVQSAVIFGLRPTPDLVAAVTEGVSLVLGLAVVRPAVTPTIRLKRPVSAVRDAP